MFFHYYTLVMYKSITFQTFFNMLRAFPSSSHRVSGLYLEMKRLQSHVLHSKFIGFYCEASRVTTQ